jgi:hypothetical protein
MIKFCVDFLCSPACRQAGLGDGVNKENQVVLFLILKYSTKVRNRIIYFAIAKAFNSCGIFSIAYLRAVLGIVAFFRIT